MLLDPSHLANKVKSRKIIALGEALHNREDLHRDMRQTVRSLVNTANIAAIYIENPAFNTSKINQWICHEKDLSQKQVRRLLYRVWRTNQFIELLNTIRRHNKNVRKKIPLIGFDVRQPDTDLTFAAHILTSKKAKELTATRLFKTRRSWRTIERNCISKSKSQLSSLKRDLSFIKNIKKSLSPSDQAFPPLDRVSSWIKSLLEMHDNYGLTLAHRDHAMYRELQRTLGNLRRHEKAIIIGHAVHLMPASFNMQAAMYDFKMYRMTGELLRNKYDDQYAYVHFTLGGHSKSISSNQGSLESHLSHLAFEAGNVFFSDHALSKLIPLNAKIKTLSDFKFPARASISIQAQSAFALKWKQNRYLFDYLSFRQL